MKTKYQVGFCWMQDKVCGDFHLADTFTSYRKAFAARKRKQKWSDNFLNTHFHQQWMVLKIERIDIK